MLDAFRLFDQEGKGWVTAAELSMGIDELGFYATREDVYLFVRRWDKDNDGRVRYSDWCDAMTPTNGHFAELINSRSPFHIHHTYSRREYFHPDTREQLRRTLKEHFCNEGSAEVIRQRLATRPYFDAYDAFKTLDIDNHGYITGEEMRVLLREHGFSATSQELITLVDRYDKKKEGRISYTNFLDETTPKSPLKL